MYHMIEVTENSKQKDNCSCAAYVGGYSDTNIFSCNGQKATREYVNSLKEQGSFESRLAGWKPAQLRLYMLNKIINK